MSRLAIVGAGAIGSFLGARLHEAGHEVLLIARGTRLEALGGAGVLLSEGGTERQVRVPVSAACDPAVPPDHVILATKTFQLESALALLEPLRENRFTLLTVQNGVEAPGIAQAALPRAVVLGARMHGFFELDGGIVRHTGVPATLLAGPVADRPTDPAAEQAAASLAADLEGAGVPTTLVDDVRPALWDKFLMAATIGGVAPAFGLKVGQMLGHPQASAMLRVAMEEVAGIAAVLGIALPPGCIAEKLDFIGRFPPDVTSSLQRDLEAARPSEYAQLTGAIPRFGQRAGLPTPATDAIIAMLHARGLMLS
ncbi:ketopantoate reductase [Novosphingobium kunmingense]|uniref:2-dehydropantoate 2-reductase n=1 Tax=Novosphingobium kunmingense TaxID=1211806 RepID=A0A2N0H3W3_9SPHN|nr:2-dehydropantoate 2-reductase [Novosphingobium kunmingense]PKB13625.1 ketopantoate reductase [Novosphingobium kunmingense]